MTVHELMQLYGNKLTDVIAEREGWANERDQDYLKARIRDYVSFPIESLTGSWFDTGHMWYSMYKRGNILWFFWDWAEEAGCSGSFREAVEYAWQVLGSGPWGATGRFGPGTPRTRDDVYVAVVAMAVSWAFQDVASWLDHFESIAAEG